MKEPKLKPLVRWNPHNKVVQNHETGEIDFVRTDEERSLRNLPVPWNPGMLDKEIDEEPCY